MTASTKLHGGVIGRSVQILVLIFLLSEVTCGGLRWVLGHASLETLIYLPKGLLLAASLLTLIVSRSISLRSLFFMFALVVWSVVGLLTTGNPVQVIFGLWILIPLLVGYTFGELIFGSASGRMFKWLLLIWMIAAIGLIWNYGHDVPWAGDSAEVLGHDVETQREWSTAGYSRLAGFARASYDVAAQLLFLAIILLPRIRVLAVRVAIWIATGALLVITTSKGPVVAWLFCSIYFLVRHAGLRRLAATMPFAVTLVAFTLPLLFIGSRVEVDLSFLGLDRQLANLLVNSLLDRFTNGWPEAFATVWREGLVAVGHGIGGSGTAQKIFDFNAYILADNVMVSFFVTFGAASVLALLWYLWAINPSRALRMQSRQPILVPMTIAVGAYGIVANILEEPTIAILVGATVKILWNSGSRWPRSQMQGLATEGGLHIVPSPGLQAGLDG